MSVAEAVDAPFACLVSMPRWLCGRRCGQRFAVVLFACRGARPPDHLAVGTWIQPFRKTNRLFCMFVLFVPVLVSYVVRYKQLKLFNPNFTRHFYVITCVFSGLA